MDSVAVTVPLRLPTKKMKKRKELDALAPPHAVSRRSSGKRSSQELLSESSDERSEYWNPSTSGSRIGGRKLRARELGRGGRSLACRSLARACSFFLAGTLFLVTAVLIWLFLDVRQQLGVLRAELDQVIAGSEGVPDALQMCHTLDKNFKANITHINEEIQNLNRSLNNFSGQISNLQQKFQEVQVSLKSAPELTSVPNTVKALQNSIGQLEIDINDLKTTYNMVKSSTLGLESTQNKQRESLLKLQNTLSGLSNRSQEFQTAPSNETLVETKKLWDAISQLSKNLSRINETLSINVTWVQEDLANDHRKVVSLQDMAQNASTQILTLQQECAKRKDQEVLRGLLDSLSSKVDRIASETSQPRPQEIKQMYENQPESSAAVVSERSATRTDLTRSEAVTPASTRTSAAHDVQLPEHSTTTNQFMK